MNDQIKTIVELYDVRATFENGEWHSEDFHTQGMLNAYMPAGGFSPADPHPDQSAIDRARLQFPALKVISIAPPAQEEEGPVE
jgi:hypothetical protein